MHKVEKKRVDKKINGIDLGTIIFIVVSLLIVITFAFAKIYISSQIYYESKLVNKSRQELSLLRAEKKILQTNIEALKFKNRVTDTIFIIEEEENE